MALTGNKNLDTLILENLDDKSLVNYRQLNKTANQIYNDQNFWFNRLRTRFPYLTLDEIQKSKNGRSWSNYYIYLSQIDINKYYPKNIVEVKIATEKGDNSNKSLWDASYYGGLDVITYLIERGANVHYKHNIALKHAVSNGDKEMIKYLIEQGADPYDGGDTRMV